MDYPFFSIFDDISVINRLAEHVEKPSQRLLADRHFDTGSCGCNFHIFVKPLARRQHQAAHLIISEVLGYFHDAFLTVVIDFKCIFDKGKSAVFKYYVNDRSHDLCDSSFIHNHSHFLSKSILLLLLCPCTCTDLRDLLRDRRLPCPVVCDRQVMDQIFRTVRG